MILPVEEEMKLTDDQFEKLMKNFDDELDKYIKNMQEDFLSFYLATGFKLSSIFQNKLDIQLKTAISLLDGSSLYDIEEVKRKLKEDYKLEITDDDKTTIEEL